MNNSELVGLLNSLNIIQVGSWDESIPDDIWEKSFEGKYQLAMSNFSVDKHRWYETSVTVMKINEGFIGVRSVTDMFSEMSSISDIGWKLIFFEMEEFSTISYKRKK